MYNYETHLDKLEFVFTHRKDFLDLIKSDEEVKFLDTLFNKGGEPFWRINNYIEMRFFDVKGVAQSRTYIKVLNPILYNKKELYNALKLIKSLTENRLEFISLQQIDAALDIKGEYIFNRIDNIKVKVDGAEQLNLIDPLTNKKINYSVIINDLKGITFYFNTKEYKSEPKEEVFLKFYTKSDYIEGSKQTNKQIYQNPEKDYIERLELTLKRGRAGKNKNRILLDTLGQYIFNNPYNFTNQQDIIIQYLFREYKNLYNFTKAGEPLLNYELFFDEDEWADVNLKEFITARKTAQKEFNSIMKVKNKTRRNNQTFSARKFWGEVEKLVSILEGEVLNLRPEALNQIIVKVGIKNEYNFEVLKTPQKRYYKGKNLYEQFVKKLLTHYKSSQVKSDLDEENLFE